MNISPPRPPVHCPDGKDPSSDGPADEKTDTAKPVPAGEMIRGTGRVSMGDGTSVPLLTWEECRAYDREMRGLPGKLPDPDAGPEHVCHPLVCAPRYNPRCPWWQANGKPVPGTPAFSYHCTPVERRAHDANVALAKQLEKAGYALRPILLDILRDDIIDLVRAVLAEELPAALAKLQRGGGR